MNHYTNGSMVGLCIDLHKSNNHCKKKKLPLGSLLENVKTYYKVREGPIGH